LLDLAHAEISAKNLGYKNAKDYIEKLSLDRVLEIHLAKPGERAGLPLDSHEEITDTKLFEFVLNKATNLKAVTLETFSGVGRQLDLIKKALRRNKRRILEDVVKPKYYFATNNFTHRKVFDEVNYVWEAIDKIGPYAQDYVSNKIQNLNSKLAGSLDHINEGAEIHKTSVIGENVTIEEGVEIGAYTVIADNVFIGKNTKIGEYVAVKNGVFVGEDCHLEEKVVLKNKVLIGNNVSVNPSGMIVDEVIIDDRATIGAFSRIKNRVYIGKGTVTGHPWIEGPAVIGAHCDLRPGTYIRGNVILGDYVEFRSEAKNSIIMGGLKSNKRIIPGAAAHYGYLGDSIIGFGVNLGAGTKISNIKTDWTQVAVDVDGWRFMTGYYKFGTVIGDLSSTGCNTVINPGTLIGKAAGVYALSTLRGFVPSGHLVKMRPKQEMVKMKKITSDSLLSRTDLVNRLLEHREWNNR
jgi:NDP-sugar pyrophosphorylase family protein